MPIVKIVTEKDSIIGRLDCGSDLLESLTQICKDNDIRLGRIAAIGAVQKARIGYYHQDKREYEFKDLDQHLEILNVIGNISLKDGDPIIHAHITLSDSEGRAFGGHLAAGTIVFACEYTIEELDGAVLERGFDDETGLPLWPVAHDNE